MKNKEKILIIGPLPKPISGVSLANQIVKEIIDAQENYEVEIINTSYNKFEENLGSFSFDKFFHYVVINFKFYKVFFNDIIYITPGQTFFGVIKYMIFIMFSSFLNKELVIHVHGNHLCTEYLSLKGSKKKIFKYLISKSTKGIVLSESLKINMINFIEEKNIYVLKNFAENYLWETKIDKSYNFIKLAFLSNLMKEKGILDFLDALSILEEKGIKYKAKIAGNIDELHEYEIKTKIKRLKNVEYLGIVSGNEKKRLLEWSNVLSLPTYYSMEGQPISIIEAMSTSNLILTTKHAGIIDIVKEGEHGFFVNKNDPKDIARKLMNLSGNINTIKEIGENNYSYFKDNFTIDCFKNNLLEILKRK